MKSTTTYRILNIDGRLWCGARSQVEYLIADDTPSPKTPSEVKRIAGDFEYVDRAYVMTITRKVEETIKREHLKL